jgi:UDP-N-acetylmuramoylalanine--D-glutamate ligase
MGGEHNLLNALAAAAAARSAGAPADAVDRALRAFAPPPHRMETVAERDGVRFVNDSKATNPDAAIKALTAYPEGGVHLILGGSDKGGSFDSLAAAVARGGAVRAVYLIGDSAARIASALDAAGVPHDDCGDLAHAMRAAAAAAVAGDTILLSPACASFDQFRDYEDRGERFRALALELAAP